MALRSVRVAEGELRVEAASAQPPAVARQKSLSATLATLLTVTFLARFAREPPRLARFNVWSA